MIFFQKYIIRKDQDFLSICENKCCLSNCIVVGLFKFSGKLSKKIFAIMLVIFYFWSDFKITKGYITRKNKCNSMSPKSNMPCPIVTRKICVFDVISDSAHEEIALYQLFCRIFGTSFSFRNPIVTRLKCDTRYFKFIFVKYFPFCLYIYTIFSVEK